MAGQENTANLRQSIEHALKMATEIRSDSDRNYTLASTIESSLRHSGQNPGELHLAEVLLDHLAEAPQQIRLVELLSALLAQLDATTGKGFTEGAITMHDAMRKLPAIVSGNPEQLGAEYFARREAGLATLAEVIGPLSPRAAGAFAALAEFMVGGEQDACIYDLDAWRPEAAMSKDERAKAREAVFALDCQAIS